MTPIERTDSRIRDLQAQYLQLTRGKAVLPPKAAKIAQQIRDLEIQKQTLIDNERVQLSQVLPKNNALRDRISRLLIRTALEADTLADTLGTLREALKKYCTATDETITPHIRAAEREIAFVALLMDRTEQTKDILTRNDTLVDAHHRQTDRFITRQLSK